MRVYYSDGRSNFGVAAPVVLCDKEAIRLEGKWQAHAGDNAARAKGRTSRQTSAEQRSTAWTRWTTLTATSAAARATTTPILPPRPSSVSASRPT